MAQLNKDFEKLLHNIKIFEPSTFDEQHKIILDIDKHITENTKLLLVDSIVSLYRLELNNENFEEVNRKLATQLAKLSQIARKNKIAVLITTQVYSSLENKGIEIVSRDIARYWSKVLIRLERCGISKRRAIIVKHRHMPEGLEAEFFIEDKGITDKKIRIF
jgi:DNA repair protein RadB